jgi:hypothetical protein
MKTIIGSLHRVSFIQTTKGPSITVFVLRHSITLRPVTSARAVAPFLSIFNCALAMMDFRTYGMD